jgi:septum site-determining protein MinC
MMINQTEQINIKGIREGLLLTIADDTSFDEMTAILQAELEAKEAFLQGSAITLQVGLRPLRQGQLIKLQKLFERHNLPLRAILTDEESTRIAARELGFATRLAGSQTDLNGQIKPLEQAGPPQEAAHDNLPGGLVLKETLRSGRRIYHEGDVVIIGDVNPGSEIIAGGDVIVWGRLRGLVHAGALGDDTAVICALELSPTQLRIYDQIAISPTEKEQSPKPEKAFIKDGQIIAEQWKR